MRQQRRFERRGHHRFQIAPADVRIAELAGDHFALLGQTDLTVDGTRRLRQDGLISRTAATANGASASMEQAQGHAAFVEQRHQREFGAIQLPVRREETAVLIAVRIAEHHFLLVALMFDQRIDTRQRDQVAHDVRRVAQIGNRLEQRNHHQARPRRVVHIAQAAVQQTGFLLQQHHFDEIADGLRVRNDVVAHRPRTEFLARDTRFFEHAEFALHEIGILRVRQTQRARLRQFGEQHGELVLLRRAPRSRLRRPRA